MPTITAHRIGAPRRLTEDEIATQRHDLEKRFGSVEDLETKRDSLGISWDERMALSRLESLRYLTGE